MFRGYSLHFVHISVFCGNIHIPWILSKLRGNIRVTWILSAFCVYICILLRLSVFRGNIQVPWILPTFCLFYLSHFTHLVKVTGAGYGFCTSSHGAICGWRTGSLGGYSNTSMSMWFRYVTCFFWHHMEKAQTQYSCHLQSGWYYQLGRFLHMIWHNIGKVPILLNSTHHSPEPIFYIQFTEVNWFLKYQSCHKCLNDVGHNRSHLIKRFSWCCFLCRFGQRWLIPPCFFQCKLKIQYGSILPALVRYHCQR